MNQRTYSDKKSFIARLLEIAVGSKGFGKILLLHDDERSAVGKRPILILTCSKQIQATLQQGESSGTITVRGLARIPASKDRKSAWSAAWEHAFPNSKMMNSVVTILRLILDSATACS